MHDAMAPRRVVLLSRTVVNFHEMTDDIPWRCQPTSSLERFALVAIRIRSALYWPRHQKCVPCLASRILVMYALPRFGYRQSINQIDSARFIKKFMKRFQRLTNLKKLGSWKFCWRIETLRDFNIFTVVFLNALKILYEF